jgi:hypothetical protein
MADHINQGACPDALTGPGARDPRCPACRAMAAAGAPEMPEPIQADFVHGASGFHGKFDAYTAGHLHAYGQAMAEHARTQFAERAIDLVAFHGGPVDLEAAIRAAAQTQGGTS